MSNLRSRLDEKLDKAETLTDVLQAIDTAQQEWVAHVQNVEEKKCDVLPYDGNIRAEFNTAVRNMFNSLGRHSNEDVIESEDLYFKENEKNFKKADSSTATAPKKARKKRVTKPKAIRTATKKPIAKKAKKKPTAKKPK